MNQLVTSTYGYSGMFGYRTSLLDEILKT